jgi:hypothetical protein
MTITPLPEPFRDRFSVLFHLTSFEGAVRILRARSIFGKDTEKQANFSVGKPRPDLARNAEVLLQFDFRGQHAAFFGVPFGRGVLACPGLEPPIAFHIFPGEPPIGWPNCHIELLSYWQTNLYPGTSGLFLRDAQLLISPPSPPKHTIWRWPWKTREDRDRATDLRNHATQHRILDRLRERARGKEFSVP